MYASQSKIASTVPAYKESDPKKITLPWSTYPIFPGFTLRKIVRSELEKKAIYIQIRLED